MWLLLLILLIWMKRRSILSFRLLLTLLIKSKLILFFCSGLLIGSKHCYWGFGFISFINSLGFLRIKEVNFNWFLCRARCSFELYHFIIPIWLPSTTIITEECFRIPTIYLCFHFMMMCIMGLLILMVRSYFI